MGYESRIYVVDYHKRTNYAEVLCMMKLSKMRYEFSDMFQNDVEYETYLDDPNKPTATDCYGDHIKDLPIQTVIDWLENEVKTEDYRRLAPCLAMLKGFEPQQWDDLRVVHYGY